MENVISRNNSHDHQSRSKVYSSSGKEYKDSDSYIDSSEIDSHLDVIPISGVNTIEYTQENLTKMIPGFTMINCIYSSYPDLITKNNEITLESLVEILKEGARVNCFECFGDDLILSLAESLNLPLSKIPLKTSMKESNGSKSSEESKQKNHKNFTKVL